MAKNKGAKSVSNRAAYCRVSFLYQAAALLARQQANEPQHQKQKQQDADSSEDAPTQKTAPPPLPEGMSRRLLTQMRSVSRKTNMRLRPAIKHTVCKFCDSLLVEGETCTSTVENKSRKGRKPWADELVVRCHACQNIRRYPVSIGRRPARKERQAVEGDAKMARKNKTSKCYVRKGWTEEEMRLEMTGREVIRGVAADQQQQTPG